MGSTWSGAAAFDVGRGRRQDAAEPVHRGLHRDVFAVREGDELRTHERPASPVTRHIAVDCTRRSRSFPISVDLVGAVQKLWKGRVYFCAALAGSAARTLTASAVAVVHGSAREAEEGQARAREQPRQRSWRLSGVVHPDGT